MAEAALQREILDALEKMGIFRQRCNSGVIRKGRRFIQLWDKGTADVVAFLPDSRIFWFECKDPDGRTKKSRQYAQGAFRKRVLALGHHYVRCESLDDVLEALKGDVE
jgi:hypothetical protein